MTIPRTKTFNNKRGFQAEANVGINSPQQSNNQSVNVILRGIPQAELESAKQPIEKQDIEKQQTILTKDKRFDCVLNKADT